MIRQIPLLLILLLIGSCSPSPSVENWCDHPIRKEFAAFEEVKTSSPWFKVYRVGEDVYAIAEPFNFQEVISYLIVGKKKNILFDSGMGMDSISKVVKELSTLPVIVINSHTHYDHIGGNHEFDTIYAVDTAYTHHFSELGWTHDQLKQEVRPDAFCKNKQPMLDTADYSVKPYKERIKQYLKEGEVVELGGRQIEVWRVPGHTPDGITLLDRQSGYLWTGDNYYTGTIWLFFDGTDLEAYERTAKRFAEVAPSLKKVFPAHNAPGTDPNLLIAFNNAFQAVKRGEAVEANSPSDHPADTIAATLTSGNCIFRIRRDYLRKFRMENR